MNYKVLIIDDDPHIVKMVESRLRAAGYSALTAFSGKEGLGSANKEKPDLILLDISMPEMDGLEVLSRLKKSGETRSIPVIMLTGNSGTEEMLSAEELGSADYIIKPFEAEEFLGIIEKYIKK